MKIKKTDSSSGRGEFERGWRAKVPMWGMDNGCTRVGIARLNNDCQTNHAEV